MYSQIHRNIQSWYHSHGRTDLPWRNTANPYHIYLSEIMLQQTQVKTVLERFYFPFLEQFPTFTHVSQAHLDEILKAWEGLGYYSRARHLHLAAQQCDGILPDNAAELEKLPGIGKSTAHAIACFAFGADLPILDANVKRILYRFFAIESCSTTALWERAYALFDSDHSYLYNQTLMDIGALICRHTHPLCDQCPLAEQCQGQKHPKRYPTKKAKKPKPIRRRTIQIYTDRSTYGLTQNQTRLLQGLWSFLQTDSDLPPHPHATHLGEVIHHYTHFTLHAEVWLYPYQTTATIRWFTMEEIDELALSGADHKVLKLLHQHLGFKSSPAVLR